MFSWKMPSCFNLKFISEFTEFAEFQMNITLDECDILTGAFQCALAADVMILRNVIIRGMYDLKKTSAAKPGLKCNRKGKANFSKKKNEENMPISMVDFFLPPSVSDLHVVSLGFYFDLSHLIVFL